MNSKTPLCLLEIKSLCTSPLPLDMQTKKIYQIGGNPISLCSVVPRFICKQSYRNRKVIQNFVATGMFLLSVNTNIQMSRHHI